MGLHETPLFPGWQFCYFLTDICCFGPIKHGTWIILLIQDFLKRINRRGYFLPRVILQGSNFSAPVFPATSFLPSVHCSGRFKQAPGGRGAVAFPPFCPREHRHCFIPGRPRHLGQHYIGKQRRFLRSSPASAHGLKENPPTLSFPST